MSTIANYQISSQGFCMIELFDITAILVLLTWEKKEGNFVCSSLTQDRK